jgi:hypothetical protein
VGLFRRSQPSDSELERLASEALGKTGTVVKSKTKDVFVLEQEGDGKVHDHCWFCGEEIVVELGDKASGAAMLVVEPLGGGESLHGLCHAECAERAKGSVSPDGF